MSYTKRQFVEMAYESIGYALYTYDLEPEQLELAMRRMDGMLSTWYGRGVQVGYPIPASPQDSDLDEETSVPDFAVEAIYLNLAIRVAPTVGKVAPDDLKVSAKAAYNELLQWAARPREAQLPSSLPAGAGNKSWRRDNPFVLPPNEAPLQLDESNGQLIFT